MNLPPDYLIYFSKSVCVPLQGGHQLIIWWIKKYSVWNSMRIGFFFIMKLCQFDTIWDWNDELIGHKLFFLELVIIKNRKNTEKLTNLNEIFFKTQNIYK